MAPAAATLPTTPRISLPTCSPRGPSPPHTCDPPVPLDVADRDPHIDLVGRPVPCQPAQPAGQAAHRRAKEALAGVACKGAGQPARGGEAGASVVGVTTVGAAHSSFTASRANESTCLLPAGRQSAHWPWMLPPLGFQSSMVALHCPRTCCTHCLVPAILSHVLLQLWVEVAVAVAHAAARLEGELVQERQPIKPTWAGRPGGRWLGLSGQAVSAGTGSAHTTAQCRPASPAALTSAARWRSCPWRCGRQTAPARSCTGCPALRHQGRSW